MTKLVHPNAMVAHLWANQSQPEARSSNGNFWYRGDTLYSYQTPIARLVNGTALFSSTTYSPTTQGKHMRPAWRAVSHRGFSVPDIGRSGGRAGYLREDGTVGHAANLAFLMDNYIDELKRMSSARDIVWWSTLDRLTDAARIVFNYADTFDCAKPEINVQADHDAMQQARADREAKRNTPQAIAKRERERARKAEREATKELRRVELEATKRADWLSGVLNHWNGRDEHGGAYLRLSNLEVQTSQGARVPADDARRIFPFIIGCRNAGKPWHRNGQQIAVGSFQLDAIDTQGNTRAGCHLIMWPQIERIARELGLIAA